MNFLILSSLFIWSVHAHGYMSKPNATYFDESGKTNYIMRVDARTLFPAYTWDYSPSENALEYQRLVNNGGIAQPLRLFMNQRINGCPMNKMDVIMNTNNFDTMDFQNDQAREGLISTHSGPCEIWIDDIRVFSDMNCAEHYKDYPTRLPVDYSKCTSDTCQLAFYWCAMHESWWQLFKHCVTISNTQGAVSKSTTSTSQPTSTTAPLVSGDDTQPTEPTSTTELTEPSATTSATTTSATIEPTEPTATTSSSIPIIASPIKKCHMRSSIIPTFTSPAVTTATVSINPFGFNTITNNYIVDGGAIPETRGVNIHPGGITLSMHSSPRIYMLDDANSKYQMFDLRGRKLSFDVNIIGVPCGYNLALYFSQMSHGATIGFGYCDAQGQGYACPEMDIFEGNLVATRLTSHPCIGSSCDRDGVSGGIWFKGVGNKTHIETSFIVTDGILTRIEQTVSWNGITQSINITETTAYGGLKQMGEAFKAGMVLIMSIWTAGQFGMDWLNGKCISYETNFEIVSGSFSGLTISLL